MHEIPVVTFELNITRQQSNAILPLYSSRPDLISTCASAAAAAAGAADWDLRLQEKIMFMHMFMHILFVQTIPIQIPIRCGLQYFVSNTK
jgi:hypothetical protein